MMAQVRYAGPFANDGERRAVDALRRGLPPNAVIITNLFLPVDRDTLEIDAVVVAPFGVVAVEVKNWHGRVHFEAGRKCRQNDEYRADPREGISLKAKKLHGRIDKLPIQKNVVTNPVLLFANDTVQLTGNLEESVRALRLSEGAQRVAEGRVGKFRSASTLSDREIQIIADALHSDHDSTHRRRVGQYVLGDALDSPFDEWWAFEGEQPDFRVRLRRFALDPLAPGRQREEQLNLARRNLVALRRLERLRLRSLPLVYATFPDPNDDTAMWTATEAIDGPTLLALDWSNNDKLAALAQVAETLAACHGEGIVHRALTSDCVIVPERDRTARVLHFDLARVTGRETVAKGEGAVRLQDLFAAAPEARSSPSRAEPASDVYSLGIVVAEALLRLRFEDERAMREAIRKIKPRGLPQILFRSLEKQAAKRPSMHELADLLRREIR
jgi:serine/threonine protein kinase